MRVLFTAPVPKRLHLRKRTPTGFFTPAASRWSLIIGYARVSTTEQNLGLRHDDLEPAFDASVDPTEARLRNDAAHLSRRLRDLKFRNRYLPPRSGAAPRPTARTANRPRANKPGSRSLPGVRALYVLGVDGFRRLTRLRSGSAVAARPHCLGRGVSAGVSRLPTRPRLAHTTRKQPLRSRPAPPGI